MQVAGLRLYTGAGLSTRCSPLALFSSPFLARPMFSCLLSLQCRAGYLIRSYLSCFQLLRDPRRRPSLLAAELGASQPASGRVGHHHRLHLLGSAQAELPLQACPRLPRRQGDGSRAAAALPGGGGGQVRGRRRAGLYEYNKEPSRRPRLLRRRGGEGVHLLHRLRHELARSGSAVAVPVPSRGGAIVHCDRALC